MRTIAIIGAGISGLRAAQLLRLEAKVTLFEKSRGVSGRMSTRYNGDYEFDHGAQYFTAKSQEFSAFLQPYIQDDIVAPWIPDGLPEEERKKYIGTPRMNSLCKVMAQDLDVRLGTRVETAAYADDHWVLTGPDGALLGNFDGLIVTAPAEQARAILGVKTSAPIKAVSHTANFTLMAGLSEIWSGSWEALRPENDIIGWATVNSSKPGRNIDYTAFVIQSRNDWAQTHKDADRDWVQAQLISAFKSTAGIDVSNADVLSLHRWLYANVCAPLGADIHADDARKLIIAGDGCLGGRVESAWQSGDAAGRKAVDWLTS